jgi:hypothetical protein
MMTLDDLAIKHGADKSTITHGYTPIYERFFQPLRNKELSLIEIGFGGYHFPERGGAGARMWADYFHRGKIVTLDLYDKHPLNHERIKFYKGAQDDSTFLRNVVEIEGAPDIIVDDGSHISPLTIESFRILFPMLKPGGWYVIEDLHASYWDVPATDGTDFKGGINNPNAILNFLKALVDSLNYKDCPVPNQNIHGIHFFEKIVFIQKS